MQNKLVKNSLCKKVLDHRCVAQECLSLGVITKKAIKDEEAEFAELSTVESSHTKCDISEGEVVVESKSS